MAGTSTEVSNDGIKEVVIDVADDIQELLENVHPFSRKSRIFKVPVHIRSVNDACYTPKLISLGPLHHGDEKLKSMEIYKVRYLDALLREYPDIVLQDLINCLRSLEEKARNSYQDHSTFIFTTDQFVKLMLLDGCFIITFLLLFVTEDARDQQDPIFYAQLIHDRIYSDMFLLENQLPYFVLEQLYSCIFKNKKWYSLSQLVDQFCGMQQPLEHVINLRRSSCGVAHFLEYRLKRTLPPVDRTFSHQRKPSVDHMLNWNMPSKANQGPPHQQGTFPDRVKHILGYEFNCSFAAWMSLRQERERMGLPSATELHQSGIEFSKCDSIYPLDVRFKHGRIQIPCLRLTVDTEERFRNLIALEHYRYTGASYTTDYVQLLDYLINTTSDAALLRSCGILDNFLGSDEDAVQIFNNTLKGVTADITQSHYYPLIKRVNAHYDKPWNSRKAKLRQDYFNTPWAFISFIAALVLLTCTLVQTGLSIVYATK